MFKNKRIMILSLVLLSILILNGCSAGAKKEVTIDDVKSYISSTNYKELSFDKVLTDLKLKNDNIKINDFNYVIDKDEYLAGFNISYLNIENKEAKTLIYRRELDRLSIISSTNKDLLEGDIVDITKLIDENLELDVKALMTSEKHKNVFAKVINHTKEGTMTLRDSNSIYVNNEKVSKEIKDVKGVIIGVYPQPVQPDDVITYYIYN